MPNNQSATFFLLLLLYCSSTSLAQESVFEIHLAGKSIGGINAKLDSNAGVQTYDIVSEVNFKVLWKKYNRKTKNFIRYKGNKILESYSGIYMNDVLEDTASMIMSKGQYNCFIQPDKNFIMKDIHIDYLAAMLYFQEPKKVTQVYSERFLKYCKLEAKGNGKYVIYLPNGKENIYTYKNGKLIEVFVDRTWFNLRFKRI